MRTTARFCLEQGVVLDAIVTSPLVRAVQTAEILAEGLGFDGPIDAHAEIAFPARIETLTRLIDQAPGNWRGLALVGHEPTLGVLAHHLLGPDARLGGVRKGAVLALEYASGRARFRFLVLGDGPKRYDALSEQ
jgi:phosphohistidine phosphatase